MRRSIGRALLVAIIALAGAVRVDAAQRTFVASTGDDANVCSIVAPCRSFGEAATHTASGGEIIVLDSAGYGAATITQSLSIIAPPGVYAGISVFTGDGIAINGSGIDVTLRGLTINGQGGTLGIHILDAARVRIEECVVSAMASTGIYLKAQASTTIVNTRVRGNGGDGIYLIPANPTNRPVVLEHVRSEENGITGLFADNNVQLVVNDSMFTRNAVYGMHLFPDTGEGIYVNMTRSTIAQNGDSGIRVSGAGTTVVVLSDNAIVLNISFAGGALNVPAGPNYLVYTTQNNVIANNSGIGTVVGGGTLQTLPLK